MTKLTANESVLLTIVAHQNDALKYLRKAIEESPSLPAIKDDLDFQKFVQLQQQSDHKVKHFLRSLQNYE